MFLIANSAVNIRIDHGKWAQMNKDAQTGIITGILPLRHHYTSLCVIGGAIDDHLRINQIKRQPFACSIFEENNGLGQSLKNSLGTPWSPRTS